MATTKKTEEVKATETVKTEKVAEVKAETKPVAKKAPAKKPAAKKAPAKKAPAKKTEVKANVFVEFDAKQFAAKSVVDDCVKAFKAENKGATVKTVEVYINASEGKAYYVVNGNAEGKYIEL